MTGSRASSARESALRQAVPPLERGRPQFVIEGEEGAGGRLPRTDLADAQAALTEALQRDASLLEARLRLGRVLLLRGKPHDALPELERIARESSNQRAQNAFGEAMQPQVDRDPWLDYLKGQPDRIDSLAGELRSLIP